MAKKIMEDFRLMEISAVDRPAQVHAKMTIMKRHDPLVLSICKAFTKDDEPMTFSAILEQNEEQSRKWKAQEALWPIMDAFRESTGKIISNTELSDSEQLSMLETSTSEFLSAIRTKFPEVEAELNKLFPADANVGDHIGKKENQMSDELKKVADLEKQVADLKKAEEARAAEVAELTLKSSMSDVEKSYYATLDDSAKKSFGTLSAADRLKKAKSWQVEKDAGDEVIKTVDGLEVRKSVVGDAMFAIVKGQEARLVAQADDLKKAREATAMAGFTKRAETELNHLPGETVAKAEVLKSVADLPEAVRTTLDTMLKAGDNAMKAAFDTIGKRQDAAEGSVEATAAKKVAELRKADSSLSEAQAVTKVYAAHPELYDQQQTQPVAN